MINAQCSILNVHFVNRARHKARRSRRGLIVPYNYTLDELRSVLSIQNIILYFSNLKGTLVLVTLSAWPCNSPLEGGVRGVSF